MKLKDPAGGPSMLRYVFTPEGTTLFLILERADGTLPLTVEIEPVVDPVMTATVDDDYTVALSAEFDAGVTMVELPLVILTDQVSYTVYI